MHGLRRPIFVAAYIVLVVIVCLELGVGWFGSAAQVTSDGILAVQAQFGDDAPSEAEIRADMQRVREANETPDGYGVRGLALVDAVLLLTMTWMLLTLFVPQRVQARVQGIVTAIVALVLAGVCLLRLVETFTVLIVMVSLVLATPFGFLAYVALWGFFGVGTAKAILSASMFLKVVFAILLVLAQQSFLRVKLMIALILTSLVLNIVAAFLIGIVPPVLASVTDAIAGIVDAIAGLIWAVILFATSLVGVYRALRMDRVFARAEG